MAEAIRRRLTDRDRLPEAARLWHSVLAALRRRVGTRRANEWARSARPISLSDDEAVVAFPDRGSCQSAIHALLLPVQDSIRDVTNRKTRLRFVVDPHIQPRRPLPPMEAARRDGTRRSRRTAGTESDADPAVQEAMRMCRAFLAERGRAPRTFFVWGPEGSGKTRFLELCREALVSAGREVVSMGADHFRSLSETARREGKMEGLRARFQGTCALLLDDAHSWARRNDAPTDLFGQPWLVLASQAPLSELPALRRVIASRGGTVVEARLVGPGAPPAPSITLEDVLEAVAAAYGVPGSEIVDGARRATEARQVYLVVARRFTGLGLAAIAREIGGARTSAHRAAASLERRLERDPALRRRIAAIEASLRRGRSGGLLL